MKSWFIHRFMVLQSGLSHGPVNSHQFSSYLRRKLRFGFGGCLIQWAGDDAADAAWIHTPGTLSNDVRWHTERRRRTSWHRNPGTKPRSCAQQDWERRQPPTHLQGEKVQQCFWIWTPDIPSHCNTQTTKVMTTMMKVKMMTCTWRIWQLLQQFQYLALFILSQRSQRM